MTAVPPKFMRWAGIGLTVPPNFGALRSFEHFRGTRVEVVEGCDLNDHGIVRTVTYWFDDKGHLIQRNDPEDGIG